MSFVENGVMGNQLLAGDGISHAQGVARALMIPRICNLTRREENAFLLG